MANGRFIPSPSPALLLEIARQRGQAAQAPLQLIGQGLGTVGEVLQKRKLSEQKAQLKIQEITQKEQESKRKDLQLFLQEMLGKGQFGQQPSAGAIPIPQRVQQFAPQGAGFFTPTTKRTGAGESFIEVTENMSKRWQEQGKGKVPVGARVKLSTFRLLNKPDVQVAKQEIDLEKKKRDIIQNEIQQAEKQLKSLQSQLDAKKISEDDFNKNFDRIFNFVNEKRAELGIPRITAKPVTPKAKGNFIKKSFSFLKKKVGFGGGEAPKPTPKKAKTFEELGI